MSYWRQIFILSYIFIYFVGLTNSQPDFLNHYCGYNDTGSMYESNKNTLLSTIPSNIDSYGFFSTSYGQSFDRVNTMALCRGDVGFDTCRSCVNDSAKMIMQLCPNYGFAIGWYDNCMLRVSNYPISGDVETRPAGWYRNPNNVSDVLQFNQSLVTLVQRLRNQAVLGGSRRKFAIGSTGGPNFTTIYALLQCTPDLSEQQCSNCLDSAILDIPRCCERRRGGRILTPSCVLRFEEYNFYDESRVYNDTPASVPQPSPPGKDNEPTQIIIIIIVPTAVSVILILCICIFFLKKRKQRKPKQYNESMDEISMVESLRYDFDNLRSATDNFSDSNKLGQGGFGAVYKGRLQNGQEIAVKRLSKNSRQGEVEFKNEVLLVMKLQHRNLVKLLGFCLQGMERLLIYEFVPNGSLDHFVFDPHRKADLDWPKRYNIMEGISRGLLYLHEDSRLRIIHRDLKASNILLDAEMNSKISDFGLARLFVLDETQGNTRKIAGTYGYMAPEYAMLGQFSAKSDVYSFGILILEIISGQKNTCFQHGENVEDLPSYAWKNWQNGTSSNLIDPTLRTSSDSVQDIIKCIHIGLLCVQENVTDRPTMASVALMLNSFSLTFPLPSKPAFFLHSSIDPEMPLPRSEVKSGCWSVNEASITELSPR